MTPEQQADRDRQRWQEGMAHSAWRLGFLKWTPEERARLLEGSPLGRTILRDEQKLKLPKP
jgi:hypothetical protein